MLFIDHECLLKNSFIGPPLVVKKGTINVIKNPITQFFLHQKKKDNIVKLQNLN